MNHRDTESTERELNTMTEAVARSVVQISLGGGERRAFHGSEDLIWASLRNGSRKGGRK